MHVQLNTTTTDPTLQISAIQQIASAVPGLNVLYPGLIAGLSAATVNTLGTQTLLGQALGGTGLYPLKTSAAAFAVCTTPYVPVGNYTNVNAGLTSAPLSEPGTGPSLSVLEACCSSHHQCAYLQ